MRLGLFARLFAPEEEAGGGGDDGFVLDDEPVVEEKSKGPTVEDLQKQITDLSTRTKNAEANADFWAARATRGAAAPAPAANRDEVDDEPEVEQHKVDAKPEDLLDDMTIKGAGALLERGFVTKADLDKAVKDAKQETRQEIGATRKDAELAIQLQNEFPEIAQESIRFSKDPSYRTESELFKRTGEIYREAVAMDPDLLGSKSLLITAARQAAAEMKAEGKTTKKGAAVDTTIPSDRQERRRERIDSQRPARGSSREESEGEGTRDFTPEQLTIMKNLKVSDKDFRKYQTKGGR